MPSLWALSETNVNYHSNVLSDSHELPRKKSVKYNEKEAFTSIHISNATSIDLL